MLWVFIILITDVTIRNAENIAADVVVAVPARRREGYDAQGLVFEQSL